VVRLTVANDSPELLDLFGEVLASDRHVPTLLDSIDDDLIDRIRCSAPHLLVIDLRHGDDARRGWRIVQELRLIPEYADLPVILCSADPVALSNLQADLCKAAGVEPLTLPFEMDDLLRTVRRLTDGKEAFTWS
jgi:DNA-binding response OmpR family regulator